MILGFYLCFFSTLMLFYLLITKVSLLYNAYVLSNVFDVVKLDALQFEMILLICNL